MEMQEQQLCQKLQTCDQKIAAVKREPRGSAGREADAQNCGQKAASPKKPVHAQKLTALSSLACYESKMMLGALTS